MNRTLTDLQIEAQTAILDDQRTKKHGIEVLEDSGVITLKGTIPSHMIREIAESVIRDLDGVIKIDNKLEVSEDHETLEKILR
ncbi:MAG: BON domain-containing protein [Anaerolineales bacterium]|nr:BON domain-containing protein [Anaerolineales bacterium]